MAWPVLRNSERFNLESLFWINKKSTQKEHLKIFWVEKSSKVDFSLANKIMKNWVRILEFELRGLKNCKAIEFLEISFVWRVSERDEIRLNFEKF